MTNAKFENIPIAENNDPMVNLKDYPFIIAPMYFDWKLSDTPDLWTRKAIADKLIVIQNEHLEPLERQFKIWDPWRSRIVQNNIYQKFWNELQEENPEWDDEKLVFEVGVFVTKADDINRIPPHATGGSIDLTVVGKDNSEMDFGTAFDHFGPEAATQYFENNNENDTAKVNRRWLHQIMVEAEFETDIDEWWHFDFGNQKWALQSGNSTAFYGEVINPISFNQTLKQDMTHALT